MGQLRIPLVGNHHLGIDDATNITRILQRLIVDGSVLQITARRNSDKKDGGCSDVVSELENSDFDDNAMVGTKRRNLGGKNMNDLKKGRVDKKSVGKGGLRGVKNQGKSVDNQLKGVKKGDQYQNLEVGGGGSGLSISGTGYLKTVLYP
ncbi:hypothetical protein AgCh_023229 [Apium graveolens]